jgi:hypothetical protein
MGNTYGPTEPPPARTREAVGKESTGSRCGVRSVGVVGESGSSPDRPRAGEAGRGCPSPRRSWKSSPRLARRLRSRRPSLRCVGCTIGAPRRTLMSTIGLVRDTPSRPPPPADGRERSPLPQMERAPPTDPSIPSAPPPASARGAAPLVRTTCPCLSPFQCPLQRASVPWRAERQDKRTRRGRPSATAGPRVALAPSAARCPRRAERPWPRAGVRAEHGRWERARHRRSLHAAEPRRSPKRSPPPDDPTAKKTRQRHFIQRDERTAETESKQTNQQSPKATTPRDQDPATTTR